MTKDQRCYRLLTITLKEQYHGLSDVMKPMLYEIYETWCYGTYN